MGFFLAWLLLSLIAALCETGFSDYVEDEVENGDLLMRSRRGVTPNCFMKYYAVSPEHSICLTPPRRAKQGAGMRAVRQAIIQTHNDYRATVGTNDGQPIPTNMMKTVWDWELARIAQKWAQNCVFMHDLKENRNLPGRFSVGQNMAKISYDDWNVAIDLWWSEIEHFSYGEGSTNGQAVGHYTQMAWASSTRIGCGYALCNETDHFYVCNYGPGGNLAKLNDPNSVYKPYETEVGATRGSACPAKYAAGQCDCRGKSCKNGGTVNCNTCRCECLNRDWIRQRSYCPLKCSAAKDSSQCESKGGSITHDQCHTYFDIGYTTCPIMCRWCKQSDGQYWEPGTVQEAPAAEEDEGGDAEPAGEETNPGPAAAAEEDAAPVASEDPNLPECAAPDLAKCGQPDTGGYWPAHYCIYAEVKTSCPAMCGDCRATSCASHDGNIYQVGQKWVTPFGRMTCTPHIIIQEQGK